MDIEQSYLFLSYIYNLNFQITSEVEATTNLKKLCNLVVDNFFIFNFI
jgi:hypothetical protein